jgi:hypothetical protein
LPAPFGTIVTTTRDDGSCQSNRTDSRALVGRCCISASGSHCRRIASSLNAARARSGSTATVRVALTLKPSDIWWRLRMPRARS